MNDESVATKILAFLNLWTKPNRRVLVLKHINLTYS